MYSYDQDIIDELQRKLDGRPPKKEITLPPESLMTIDEVTKDAMKIYNLLVK